MTNNDYLYDDFETSLMDLNQDDPFDRGFLGYTDEDNIFSVFSDKSRSRYRVRLDDGTNIEARHNGSVQPIPNLPIIVIYDSSEQPVIDGPDRDRLDEFAGNLSPQISVGPHSHHRGSGMEFPVDPMWIERFRPIIETNWTIYFTPGDYVDNQSVKWWNGGILDLSDYESSITVGYHQWVMVLLDKSLSPPQLVLQNGSEKLEALPLLKSELEEIQIPSNQLPLIAIKIRRSDAKLYQQNIVSLLTSSSSGGGASSSGYPDPVTFDYEVEEGYTLLVKSGWSVSAGGSITLNTGSVVYVV